MAQGEYELAFYGKIVDSVALEKVQANIALLFKASGEQVARMFTGKRVVIRNKLDEETALKYVIAMKKRGALCQIEKMGQPGVEVNFPAGTDKPAAPAPTPSVAQSAAAIPTPASTPTPKPTPEPIPEPEKAAPKKVQMANPNALPVAGEKVDDILSSTNFGLDPTGIRLSEEHEEIFPEHHELDDVTLAPTGSDLVDKKEEVPVALPDISHLSIKPD